MATDVDNIDPVEREKMLKDFLMNTEAERLATFKDWPFAEDCGCIPSKVHSLPLFDLMLLG